MRFAATNGEEDIEAFTTTAQASSATRRLAQIICVTGYADCKTAPGYKEADTGVVKEKMRNTPKNLETALSHLCTPPPGRPVLSDAAIGLAGQICQLRTKYHEESGKARFNRDEARVITENSFRQFN